jgi:hypothetical protein
LPNGQRKAVRIAEAHDARQPRLEEVAPRIARQREHGQRRAVVAARARDDLLPPRDEARDLDGVLVGLGA